MASIWSVNAAILSDAAWTGAVFARDLPRLGRDDAEENKRPIPAEIACRCDSRMMSTIHAREAGDAAAEKLLPGSPLIRVVYYNYHLQMKQALTRHG